MFSVYSVKEKWVLKVHKTTTFIQIFSPSNKLILFVKLSKILVCQYFGIDLSMEHSYWTCDIYTKASNKCKNVEIF